jgi:PAS domain S-box-containing protein
MKDERKTKAQLIGELEEARRQLAGVERSGDAGAGWGERPGPIDALLRSLFESMAEGMILIAPDGRIVEANPAAEQILGLTRSELSGRHYTTDWDIVDSEGHPMPPEEMPGPRAMNERRPVRDKVMGVRHPDGSIGWLNVSAAPVRREDGELAGVVGTFADITKRKLAEEALRESQEKFRAQYKGIPIPTYTWQLADDDLVLIDYNDAAGEITRGGVADYVGLRASEMYRDSPEIREELRRCARERVLLERTMPYRLRTTGESKLLAVRYVPVPPDLVMVHTEDITETGRAEEALRESEERLRSTLTSMDDLVFVLDRDLRFDSFHQPGQAGELYVRPADFLGKTLDDVLPPPVASLGREAVEAALATGVVQQFDYPLELGDEERWYSAKASPRLGVEGEPSGATVVVREITQRKRAERALAEAHATLEQRVEERTRELAGLREQAEQLAAMRERERLARDLHDAVTQTLFSVSLIADALPALWEKDPEAGRRQLAELGGMTRGALSEMRGLLLELRPTALADSSLGDLLRRLADSMAGRAGLSVEVSVDGEETVSSELKIAFYRIAQEALNNVAKHAAASRTELLLVQRPGRVEMRVRDDGRGFDRAAVPSGRLGLSIMKERAEAAGARLSIESRPGGGTLVAVDWTGPETGEG